MGQLHSIIIWIHIIAGTLSIATFWVPTLSKKGGTLHKSIGHWYINAMYVVAATALLAASIRLFAPLSLMDNSAAASPEDIAKFIRRSQLIGVFLMVLALLVLANVRHGILALRAKTDRVALRRPLHLSLIVVLGIVGAFGLYFGVSSRFVLLQIFSPLALLSSYTMLRYSFKSELKRSEWVIEHLNNLLGAGTATHTALFVLGAARIMNSVIPVSLNLLPWVAPGIVGVVASYLWTRRYRIRFGHITSPSTPSSKPIELNSN